MKKLVELSNTIGFIGCCRTVVSCLVVVLFSSWSLVAQAQVSGTVTDNTGLPMIGATVLVKGTTQGTVTDFDGKYSIQAGPADVLVFSFVGFLKTERTVGDQTVVDVVLEVDSQQLDEVVLVGYGTQKKSDLSGSVASIKEDEIKSFPVASAEQTLQGKVSGVQIIQSNAAPGGAATVRIRGGNSVLGSSEPLYVIDGYPVSTTGSDAGGVQPPSILSSINPEDITSIEVLKDASATAIYGARGANGVIIISTKRGTMGKPSVSFQTYAGMQTVREKLDLMNAQEYMALYNEKATNLGQTLPYPTGVDYVATDWQDEIFRTAPIQNYALSINGGGESNKYFVSMNYFDQAGIVKNTGFDRGSIRLNLDNQINDFFKLSTSVTVSKSNNNRSRNDLGYASGVILNALVAPPTAPVYNPDGSYYDLAGNPTADPALDNPVAVVNEYSNLSTTKRFLGNVNAELSLLEGLKFNLRMGTDMLGTKVSTYVGSALKTSPGGIASLYHQDIENYLLEGIFSYSKTFNESHNLSATVGYTYQNEIMESSSQRSETFITDFFGTDNLGAGSVTAPNSSYKEESELLSYLARVNYGYKGRYLLTATFRADGSSRFGAGNKWGYFPSFAAAWRISSEPFMQGQELFSELKLRSSYGLTGNQEIGSYNSLARLNTTRSILGEGQNLVIGFKPGNIANPDLKWETTYQFDAGLDMGFLQGRIDLTLDYYRKDTKDLLSLVPIAASSGFSEILLNSGQIRNEGFEVGFNFKDILKSDFQWDLGGNVSYNKNTVVQLALPNGEFLSPSLGSPISASVNIIREGEPLAAFYGYVEDGLWDADQGSGSIQPGALAGSIRYKDLNGDGTINDLDRTILGSPFPSYSFGLNSNMNYKNFDFSLQFQGVADVELFNGMQFWIADVGARNGNQLQEVTDRWSPDNPNVYARYPRASNTALRVSDRHVEDASYVRLRNVVLGYTVPLDKAIVNSLRIYVSGQNLWTLTDYKGYDPEISSTSGLDLRKGIDYGAYPNSKTILVGMNINF
ncbi:TonB-linked outer membrane protein, SusC/RagA family [Flagellimonas taeanensis]|uniref:TonB-linked outer membrane protein, SusC/RagA family n=1 Tax=Flagellimonas taeanensis TaxID=1005926 RepID=A0A1M6Z872_9FLAO|nr:TonB-dependent receptor [Allomuricauda taeanensis]SFC10980.1 TonB-linked outer membrane protein, SusC/RagA family [Allomuricauda taeanensis]SHL26661.1 TonB-linked outer membrane protein, SusC/RagA family [Allomuricauda taeanensis]